MESKKLWLVGSGSMAESYLPVLRDLNICFEVIGRGEESANLFSERHQVKVATGGVQTVLDTQMLEIPKYAIVATDVDQLHTVATQLIKAGVKYILLEKPGALFKGELNELIELAKTYSTEVYIGYNRRFYSSVKYLKDAITREGGVQSLTFDFTEWSDKVCQTSHSPTTKQRWFLSNSSHVVDLAFHLCGQPKQLSPYIFGNLNWHPSSSIFVGSGITETGTLFSYHANWNSAGRWGLELTTRESKYILRPIEKLFIQRKNTFNIEELQVDSTLDEKFKPGLWRQVRSFVLDSSSELCNLASQRDAFDYFHDIAGYR